MRSFEKISSFFFFARKTIAKGKVKAKYLKHLNCSFILIIGFFFENFDFNVAILETPGPIGCDKMTEMSLLIYLHVWIKQSLNKCKILSSQAVTWFSWHLTRFQRWIVPRLLAWHFLCQSAQFRRGNVCSSCTILHQETGPRVWTQASGGVCIGAVGEGVLQNKKTSFI